MTKVKSIVVSGFRGIRTRVPLDLQKGGHPESVILYGANGTGKSSVTDAWEWLATGKIQHLAREGAEEGAYPHMAARPGRTYVEVEFSDSSIGTVGLVFDNKRVTMPIPQGNLEAARKLLTLPCHIRYGDLTRFVLLRKTERYDALASLMGFVPQMEYQKALRRIQALLESDLQTQEQILTDTETRFKEHFQLGEADQESAIGLMAGVCVAQGFETESTTEAVSASSEKLRTAVTNDPSAKELADLQTLENAEKAIRAPSTLERQVAELRAAAGQLKAEQKAQLHTQLLIPLFKAADDLLTKVGDSGQCPLCQKQFDGDLRAHVKNELSRMQHLVGLLDKLNTARTELSNTLSFQQDLLSTFDATLGAANPKVSEDALRTLREAAKSIDELTDRLRTLLVFDSTAINDELLGKLKAEEESIAPALASLDNARTELLTQSQDRKASLEQDTERVKLVGDNEFVASGLKLIAELVAKEEGLRASRRVLHEFSAIVEDYVAACLEDVQKRFAEISDKVKVFFEIVERNTTGLGAPKLKLLTDQDRSVVLEVFFHGTTINPAHKYLSESQLNSFGLSVFLASATHFNKDCRFILLDDVVNSFDANKRPRVIELLKGHLKEYQVLLMTHDRFWRDLLHRRLPTWKRINFTGYTFGLGPIVSRAMDALERVENALKADEPEEAAQIFARYLEDYLQDLCEAFHVEVKFNRRSEYTPDTLIDRFRVRIREKLNATHPLCQLVEQLFQDNAYRNWSVHCKNPEAPIHADEIRTIVETWKAIEQIVCCQECNELLRYDGKAGFQCACGKSQVSKGSN